MPERDNLEKINWEIIKTDGKADKRTNKEKEPKIAAPEKGNNHYQNCLLSIEAKQANQGYSPYGVMV